jgi:hypothetical protein
MCKKNRLLRTLLIFVALLLFTSPAAAENRTLRVGPGAEYRTPCEAFKDAQDGDTIEINASGIYSGDVCRISANRLLVRGIYGKAKIDAANKSAEGKAIWVIGGNDTVIENIEFSGCRVRDKNGAGIRLEGKNLTVRDCYFHDNENGILSGENPESEILVEKTEFANNGYGDGYSHNIYIGNVKKFTMKFCYSHQSNGGQLVKSRAVENRILYNRLTDEMGSNYELDLPDGGLAYVVGNIFQQSSMATNSAIIAFGMENPLPGSRILVVNNTLVNDRHTGLFVQVDKRINAPSLIVNNIFAGPGQICSQEKALLLSNYIGKEPGLKDPGHFDYGLKLSSPCIDGGADLENLGMKALIPKFEYMHRCGFRPRILHDAIDIGAIEAAVE